MSALADEPEWSATLGSFLRANQDALTRFAGDHDPPADFFQTHSGVYQDRFVTMWPLIENVDLFDEATRLASRELLRICADEGAQVVVGSTMTVRHLFEGMRPRVAEGLRLEYLGNYPLLPLRAEHLASLKGRRAVIFTDVVSSGRLIEDTLSFLHSHNVTVVAIVALIRLVHDLTGRRIAGDSGGRLVFHAGPLSLPFRAYLDVDVAARGLDGIGTESAIQMDPTTLLPQAQTELRSDPLSAAKIALEDEAIPISRQEELRLGYYRTGNDRFTAYLNIDSIVQRNIELIRDVIRDRIAKAAAAGLPEPVLVSTPSKENRDLLMAVLGKGPKREFDLKYVLFSKIDEFEGSSAYFLLSKHESVRSHPAIVLLSSIQSTETVRWLSAILSLNGCPSVTILCVVNRTSPASASFLARVLRLRASPVDTPIALAAAEQEFDSHFELISILRLWDLSTPDLATMEALAHAQFRRFWDRCGSKVLASLSRSDLRYFEPRDVYELAPVRKTSVSRTLGGDGLTEDVRVCLAASKGLMDRDAGPLIDLINRFDLGKNSLFAIYRYLLADPATLGAAPMRRRLSEGFAQALRVVDSRIRGALAQSPDLSDSDVREEILAAIDKERNLLVGVALFSQFITGSERQEDSAGDVSNPVIERVKALLDEFESDPLGLATLGRLSDIAWGYALTFATHMLEPVFQTETDEGRLVDALDHIRENVSRAAKGEEVFDANIRLVRRLAPAGDIEQQDQSVIMSLIAALSGMIDALGSEERVSTGECLAAVRREIFWPKPRHSFCFFTLRRAPQKLMQLVDESIGDLSEVDFRHSGKELEFLTELNGLIYAASRLSRLSWQAKRVIRECYETDGWTRYFIGQDQEDLDAHVGALTEISQLIRSRNAVIRSEVDEIATICERILLHVWGNTKIENGLEALRNGTPPASEFFQFIASFECNLRALLTEALDAGCGRIAEQTGIDRDRFTVELTWPEDPKLVQIYVLCDPSLLLMAFENFVSNFKYSNSFRQVHGTTRPKPVIGRIVVSYDAELEAPSITFRSEGVQRTVGSARMTTIEDHRRRLRHFDCEIFEEQGDNEFSIRIEPRGIDEPRGEFE
jgi:hypothetical protein